MRATLLVALLLGGCWKAPPPPRADQPFPGLRWISPPSAYRLDQYASVAAIDGDSVVVAGQGEIARFDLATGARRTHRRTDVPITSLTRLRDGRLLTTHLVDGKPRIAHVDPRTLAMTPVSLNGLAAKSYPPPRVIEMPDGALLVSGLGLPLAIYDATTFALKRALDLGLDWTEVVLLEDAVIAMKDSKEIARFDLARAARTTINPKATGAFAVVGGGTTWVQSQYDGGWKAKVFTGPAPVRVFETNAADLASDPRGTRIAWVDRKRSTLIVQPTDGAERREYALGAGLGELYPHLRFDGERMLVTFGAAIRIVDLATGAITGAGTPPYGWALRLLHPGPDSVLAIDGAVWSIEGGRPALAYDGYALDLTLDRRITHTFGVLVEPEIYDRYEGEGPSVIVLDASTTPARESWRQPLPQAAHVGFLGPEGEAIISDYDSTIQRASATGVEPMAQLSDDGQLVGVDFERELLYLIRGGSIRAVSFDDPEDPRVIVRAPDCDDDVVASTSPDGTLVLVQAAAGAIVYELATGALVGSYRGDELSADWIAGSPELLVADAERFGLWNPRTGTGAFYPTVDSVSTSVAPEGDRVAVAMPNGQVALVDLAAWRRALVPGPVARLDVPAACSSASPTDRPAPEPDEPDYWDDE